MEKLEHDFSFDQIRGNELCLHCDNCNPMNCSWVDHHKLDYDQLYENGKIWMCRHYSRNGSVIKDYPKYIANAYAQRVKENKEMAYRIRKYKSNETKAHKAADMFVQAVTQLANYNKLGLVEKEDVPDEEE